MNLHCWLGAYAIYIYIYTYSSSSYVAGSSRCWRGVKWSGLDWSGLGWTYFSSSLSFSPSKSSSHPTSIKTLTPPSSSSSDCDADDSDWAPNKEQKVNMVCFWPDCPPPWILRCCHATHCSSRDRACSVCTNGIKA